MITGPSYNFSLVVHRQMNNAAEWTRNEDEAKTQTKHVAPGAVAPSNFPSLASGVLGHSENGVLRQ